MNQSVHLEPVRNSQETDFLGMAKDYFAELNPSFVPSDEWRTSYFSRLMNSSGTFLKWIGWGGERAGFVIYGVEPHRFLPRKTAHIYEFYVLPHFRRKNVGREAAEQVLQALRGFSPAKIQLEVSFGNAAAVKFWNTFGFEKVAERYVLAEGHK